MHAWLMYFRSRLCLYASLADCSTITVLTLVSNSKHAIGSKLFHGLVFSHEQSRGCCAGEGLLSVCCARLAVSWGRVLAAPKPASKAVLRQVCSPAGDCINTEPIIRLCFPGERSRNGCHASSKYHQRGAGGERFQGVRAVILTQSFTYQPFNFLTQTTAPRPRVERGWRAKRKRLGLLRPALASCSLPSLQLPRL